MFYDEELTETLLDTLESDLPSPFDEYISSKHNNLLEKYICTLKPKHEYILRSLYGIGSVEKEYREVAAVLGVTIRAVNQMQHTALKKMKKAFLKDGICFNETF